MCKAAANPPPSFSSSSSSWSRREKRKLPLKYYQLIANDDEKTEAKPLSSIKRKRLIRYLKPPGYKTLDSKRDPKDQKFPKIRGYGRKIFKALVAFVHTMHGMNLTLKGNINTCMMLWIASSKSIKLQNVPRDYFSKFTIDGGKKDYNAIADVIEKNLLVDSTLPEDMKDFTLPEDMKDWVKLLRDKPLKNMYLVRCHVALMASKAKVEHFLELYWELLHAEKLDGGKKKYNILAGGTTKYHLWTKDVGRNKYVEKVFTNTHRGYKGTARDLLRLVRNCTQHFVDHSVDMNKGKFKQEDMYYMIESCFSGLFHQFQRAMVQAGFMIDSLKETM